MKKSEIILFLEHLRCNSPKRFYLSEQFIDWYTDFKGCNAYESEDVFFDNEKRIRNIILNYISECSRKYIVSEFELDIYNNDIFYRAEATSHRELSENILYKTKWRNEMNDLIKKLDWREFELLSKIILHENHIVDVSITKSQNDQGIDFYGYFRIEDLKNLPRFYKYLNFRILGQVKHSQNNKGVDHQKVASFGTEINKMRKAVNNSYFKDIDNDFINSSLPILGIFITNSYYPSKSKNFADEYGIIYWDGEQISEDLCNRLRIESILNENSKLDIDKFKKHILSL